jgi:hypothetical protein
MKVCVKGLMQCASAGCVFLVATCLAVAAQHGSVAVDQSARVLSLENDWNQAEVTHDAQALSTLLAETFDFTDDDGRFMNKSQWLISETESIITTNFPAAEWRFTCTGMLPLLPGCTNTR